MAVATSTIAPAKGPIYQRKLFSREEYERLVEVGVFGPDDRVELIQGEIVQMTPMKSPHSSCINGIIQLVRRASKIESLLTVQTPLRLGDQSEPEPDVMLLKPREDLYRTAHPEPRDVVLLIEVSDTTVEFDREIKMPLYARYGVPEAWLIDLAARRVEVYREPRSSGYKRMERFEVGEALKIPETESVSLPVSEILGTHRGEQRS